MALHIKVRLFATISRVRHKTLENNEILQTIQQFQITKIKKNAKNIKKVLQFNVRFVTPRLIDFVE